MDAPTSHPRASMLRYDPWRALPILGVVVGYMVLYTTTHLSTAWGLYVLIALTGAFVLPIVTQLTGGLERLVLIMFVFALQFQLGFNPVYTEYAHYKQGGMVGIYISLVLLAAVGLFAIRFLRWIGGMRLDFRVHGPFVRKAAIFMVASALSMVNSPNKTISAFGLWEIFSLILIAVAVGNWGSTRDGLRLIRATLLATLASQCLVILAENVFGVHFNMQGGVIGAGSWQESRFAGTLIRPSVSSTFVVIGLFFTMARLFSTERSRNRPWLFVLFGVGFLVLLLSLTRSSWIAFGLGGTGLGWYLYRHGTLTNREVRVVAVLAMIGMMIAWPALSGRLGENHSNDADTRWNLVIIAMAMIKAHPIVGIGLNNATTLLREYAAIAGLTSVWVFIVHNQFLLIAAETGLLGLAAFLSLYWVALKCAYGAMQSEDVTIRDTAAAVFWSLVALVWSLNLDHIAGAMTYVFVFFLFGFATGVGMLARTHAEERASTAG